MFPAQEALINLNERYEMKRYIIMVIVACLHVNYMVADDINKQCDNKGVCEDTSGWRRIEITSVSPEKKKQPPKNIQDVAFGSVFTNHLFTMEWTQEKGWHRARIEPYGQLAVDPASAHLHYGSEIFEGLKAYKTFDDKTVLFRPREHLARFNESAKRMCMPEIDVDFVLKALKLLIKQDEEWIPSVKGSSLYIRPAMLATESTLSLNPSNRYLFFIILSPVSFFYKEGFNPTSILVSEYYTRASSGGVGQAKTGGNYAASMLAQREAKKQNCSQVLWLDSVEKRYVEEVGSMNIFFVIDNTIVTPSLTGTILPGITRKSVLELGKKEGLAMIERAVSLDEVLHAIDMGSCTEIFGTGTAAIIAPVGVLRYKNKDYVVNKGQTGPLTERIFNMITSIQQGIKKDACGWLNPV